ncbi:hypothetical protein BS329_09250 [Amycolatopsis coloradensis]|uniref:PASTA domain-containing protein n=1 Tax=Amycolatopsis coloradensis TaxID=76021 RepID=A0A1R0KZB0_9PSEU|nr:hypothetical protein BS329_09250 [Amycolatopsis coloradensis]
MKYALGTTLAGGGLVMLGAGVASAAGNVAPSLPATPVDQNLVTSAVSGLTEAMRQARPLDQLAAADQDSLQPAVTTAMTDVPAAVPPTTTPVGQVYPAPMGSLPSLPVVGDLRAPDLNSPLDVQLDEADLPVVPLFSRVEHAQDALTALKPNTPVHSEFELLPAPVDGTVVTDPLDAGSGTRVTVANTETLLRK